MNKQALIHQFVAAALCMTALLISLIAAALGQSDAPAPTVKMPTARTPKALIWMRWKMVDVPRADWQKIAPQWNIAEPVPSLLTKDETNFLMEALKKGHGRTVTGPMVSTLEGVEATVSAQSKVAYGPPGKRAFVTIGQSVTALPRLNQDGTVTFHLDFEDVELAGTPAENQAAPPTTTLGVTTIRTAKPGQTLALGLLSSNHAASGFVRLLLVTTDVVTYRGPVGGEPDSLLVR